MPDQTPNPQPPAPPESLPDPASPALPRSEPATQPGTVPLHTNVVPLHKRTNAWRWQAKDAQGRIVESSPGTTFFESRGPASKADMKELATILLNNHRMEAIRAGLDDPGYVVDEESIKPAAEAPPLNSTNVGAWQPPAARPIQFPNADVIQANNQRVIEEATGGAV